MSERREYNRLYKQSRREKDPIYERVVSSNNSKLTHLRRRLKDDIEEAPDSVIEIYTPNLNEIEKAYATLKILLRDKPDTLLEVTEKIRTIISS